MGPADTVGGQSTVALKVLERPNGGRPENPVGSAAVESELIEHVLEVGDIVAAEMRGADQQQTITE